MQRISLILILTAAIAWSCATDSSSSGHARATQFFLTATLPSPSGPTRTPVPAKATAHPTLAPVPGTTTTQLNVRGEPSSATSPLGVIGSGIQVQIIGKDPGGNWFQIEYAGGQDGKGWVTSQYVEVQDRGTINVIASTTAGSLSGTILQQVNVRRSPGTGSESVGILNPKDVVTVTGRDNTGAWLQIQFAAGSDAKGWVAAGYVQATGIESIPIIAQSGDVVATKTPAPISATAATAPMMAAPQDNDSAASPTVNARFSPSGTGSLLYSSDISAPEGDAQDWIGFTPYGKSVMVSLVCAGNGKIGAEIWHSGAPVQMSAEPACGKTTIVSLSSGQAYVLRLFVRGGAAALEYVHYTLRIDGHP